MSALDAAADVAGFFDARGARMILRRLKIRRALLDAKGSIETLLDSLDERAEADRNAMATRLDGAVRLIPGDLDRGDGRVAIDGIQSKDVREKELLDGVNLVLQLLDTIGVGIRHGLFSSAGDAEGTLVFQIDQMFELVSAVARNRVLSQRLDKVGERLDHKAI